MPETLKDQLSPVRRNQKYTISSFRSIYITNQIEEGKDICLIKKITGHSLELVYHHYDRSDVRKRCADATRRTYTTMPDSSTAIDHRN